MGQREYDDFKLLVKEWKNSHPEEYRIMRRCPYLISGFSM